MQKNVSSIHIFDSLKKFKIIISKVRNYRKYKPASLHIPLELQRITNAFSIWNRRIRSAESKSVD